MSKNKKKVEPHLRILGKNIRRIRKKSRKKIKQVSDDTGIPQRDIIMLEAGFNGKLDPKYLLTLEKYFNVPFSQFFRGL